MSAFNDNPRLDSGAEDILKERLRKILARDDWRLLRGPVENIAGEFDLGVLDCAAALAFLVIGGKMNAPGTRKSMTAPELKMLLYRLEVGRKHQATEDNIKKLLIEESGVENRLIGRIDIHYDYTLVQLPDGMPSEIYRHLKSVLLNRQPLRIKRLEGNFPDQAKNAKSFRLRKRPKPQAHKERTVPQGRREITRRQKD